MVMAKNFVSTDGKGFQMTFENGLTISVQWGKGNYCQNYFHEERASHCEGAQCDNAEVAVWDKNGKWLDVVDFTNEGGATGGVYASASADLVAEIMFNVKNAKV
jgi:hypothetical protein